MRREGDDRAAGWPRFLFTAVLGVAAALSTASLAGAASLIAGTYQLEWNQDVDRTDTETKDVRKLKQTVEIKYKGFFSPVVQNEMTFKVEQEINSDTANIIRFLPTLDLGFKGKYWEVKSGAKRTHENSDDPMLNPKITDSYVVELFYLSPRNIPDLKFKYTIDTEFQEGTTDTRKDGLTLSSVYSLSDWLNIKGDFTWNKSDDRLQPDVDTIDQKRSVSIELRHMFSEKLRFDTQYMVEETRGGTILDAGGIKDKKEDQSHTFKNTLAFRPFRDTTLDASYDIELKQNIAGGDHTLTNTAKATVNQKIANPINAKVEFNRVTTDVKYSADDYSSIEDTWTTELLARFSKQLDFTFKYQGKYKDEPHADPLKSKTEGTVNRAATWTGELTRFCKGTASYDATETFANEIKTAVNTKYSLKTTFDFKAVNLLIEPTYDITVLEDLVKPETSDVRDFKVKVVYLILSTKRIDAKIDHTYERKTDTLANNIQRTDNSTGNVTWKDALPGWLLGFDLTRTATDTSGDDLGPDIITSFVYKADYKYRWFTFNANYKYDKKSLADDTETLDLKGGWVAPSWEATLTYTFTKTFSVALDEGYTLALLFKYIL